MLLTSTVAITASKDLKDVLKELLDVKELWKDLGLTLKIREGRLEEIEYDQMNDRRRMWEMISDWLKGSGIEASWGNLIDALSDPLVGKAEFAEALRNKLTPEDMPDIN